MTEMTLTIPYSDDLLLSLETSSQEFEAEARFLLAVKLFELGRVPTDAAAELAGMDPVTFTVELVRFTLSQIGQAQDAMGEGLAAV